jgi:crossover junction endodeoxyribonuclease RuvC
MSINNTNICLGIDPGYATCGFSIIEKDTKNTIIHDYGVFCTEKNMLFADRLCLISNDIEIILNKYNPDILSIEKLFWGQNVNNAIKVAEVRGVIQMLSRKRGMKIYEYSPNEIKSKLVGHGKAKKFQLQNMLKIKLKLDEIPTPDDAADALAVALIALEEN